MNKNFWNKKAGFTLMEVLISVIIVAILVTMAVPMYERTIEKSHRAEVSVALKRLSESKLRTMANMDIETFNPNDPDFDFDQMDGSFQNTSDFTYSLSPSAPFQNAVCAVRARGKYSGTIFLYLGEIAPDVCNSCSVSYAANTVCGGYCSKQTRFFCQGDCDVYGMTSVTGVSCN